MDIIPDRNKSINVDPRNSFEVARSILENCAPQAVYAYFHRCVFLAPPGILNGRREHQLERLGFEIRDREPRRTTDGHWYTPEGNAIAISTPSIEAIKHLASEPKIRPYSIEIAIDIISNSEAETTLMHE